MGFGLIFIGYITLLFFKTMPPAMAVGAYMMYKGLDKLKGYGKSFKKAGVLAAVLCGYHVLYSALWIARMAKIDGGLMSNDIFTMCDSILYYALLLVFHIFLYAALEKICTDCGYIKGIKKAYMSRVLLVMFYGLTAFNMGIFAVSKAQNSYLSLAALICQVVWIIYTAVYIYGCYMRIVTDEILADERKKIAEFETAQIKKRVEKQRNNFTH